MKKLISSIAVIAALLALFFTSCSNGGNEDHNSSSSGNGDGGNIGTFENPGQITNMDTDKPYTGSGKVYFGDERDQRDRPILNQETILLAGTMNSGKITFNLPTTVDSRFLDKFDEMPDGMKAEPLGAEV